ncbi:trypsin-like peptidase domain-containing protein [Streptosporangium soli]|nr:trypsin-like peptidase domain-containing protein [Streptosporangium sp. KLBMP 9127]
MSENDRGNDRAGDQAGDQAGEQAEQGGWTQFGGRPPEQGSFPRPPETAAFPPPPEAAEVTAVHAVPGVAVKHGFTGRQKAVVGLALAAMAFGGGAAGAFVATSFGEDRPVAATSPVFSPVANTGTVSDVARAVQPSVVSVSATQGGGSGVVLTADGYILTNNHVAELAGQGGKLTVKFSDGKTAQATVKGTDPATDIAVIKAEGVSDLTKATLGDSDALKVGDSVLAIGSPLGLAGSVTSGIVSALDRTVTVGGEQPQQLPPGLGQGQQQPQQQLPPGLGQEQQPQQQQQRQQGQDEVTTIGGAIQTDAAINHGNSGGALVNAAGQVIGINTVILTAGGDGNIGVGFAIPIKTARQIAEQLITVGKATHAQLGVSLQDATGETTGALVGQITQGSPAEKAGLRVGDLITKMNERTVEEAATVVGAVRGFKPGDEVTITYVRDGRTATVQVTLTEKTGE